jgi:hypothetical protein
MEPATRHCRHGGIVLIIAAVALVIWAAFFWRF